MLNHGCVGCTLIPHVGTFHLVRFAITMAITVFAVFRLNTMRDMFHEREEFIHWTFLWLCIQAIVFTTRFAPSLAALDPVREPAPCMELALLTMHALTCNYPVSLSFALHPCLSLSPTLCMPPLAHLPFATQEHTFSDAVLATGNVLNTVITGVIPTLGTYGIGPYKVLTTTKGPQK